MYAEEMVNRTRMFYLNSDDIYIEKREIPIKIVKKMNNNFIVGKLLNKSFVDYFGYYKKYFFEFEVKETSQDFFNVNLIKPHQLEFLTKINKHGVKTFILVYFSLYSAFYLIEYTWLMKQKEISNSIEYKKIQNECYKLEIFFPGILNLKQVFSLLYI